MKTFLKRIATLTLTALSLTIAPNASAHCQIPCGIYADAAEVASLIIDADTVIKACHMIDELSGKTDLQSAQQLVRWVTNKEAHAQAVIESISNYFLTQRVKADQEDYAARLVDHHAVIVAAMKAKQNTSVEYAEALKRAITVLEEYYPSKHPNHD
jgi:nickel superoxide dismutase|tara:strand:- start:2460 stop:2927 length:468 start_codon:yes stop_codon:yes gene_type:complete